MVRLDIIMDPYVGGVGEATAGESRLDLPQGRASNLVGRLRESPIGRGKDVSLGKNPEDALCKY